MKLRSEHFKKFWAGDISLVRTVSNVEHKQHNWYLEAEIDVTFSWTYFNAYAYLN